MVASRGAAFIGIASAGMPSLWSRVVCYLPLRFVKLPPRLGLSFQTILDSYREFSVSHFAVIIGYPLPSGL